jgi:pyruvate/2-oxoglutarate dehydrogenase complex dihydrolipoamide dehydrogenase (E3) component
VRTASEFGIVAGEPQIDYRAIHDHVMSVIAAIAPNDSAERFTGLGVRVIQGAGRFLDKRTVAAGDYRISARRFVIATGSAPFVPPIPGLDGVPFFTNETMFDNERRLDHLIIIGAGPVGIEMAQAHARLGSRVVVIEAETALSKDDPELSGQLLKCLRTEGIDIREGVKAERVESLPGYLRVHVSIGDRMDVIEGTHLLLAAGRSPNIGDLNLEAGRVKYGKGGIIVDKGLRTSNSRVFAIGDVTGGQFTHMADHHAEVVIRRALFKLPAKVNNTIVPWVTYTEPELAHVGLTEQQAEKQKIAVNVLRSPFHENDRAQTERATQGHIKVLTDKKGRILGATIVGAEAGELIQMWSLAIAQGLKIKAMGEWIAPFPTLGEINRRAAMRCYETVAAKPFARSVVGILSRLG